MLFAARFLAVPQDSGLFAALQQAGVGMVLSGHDHDNNYCALHGGVRLAYGCGAPAASV